MAWNDTRLPYRHHIKHMVQYIDFLSEQYCRTGEQFYRDEYNRMTQAVRRVKQHILDLEKQQNTTI